MIISNWKNIRPMQLVGMGANKEVVALSNSQSQYTTDVCTCFGECDYKELALVNSTSNNWWQNDLSSVISGRIFASDVITFTLLKDNNQVATLNDNTLGKFYNYNSLYNPLDINYLTSNAYLNYIGYLVEWKKVKQVHGYGEYQIKTSIVSLGQTYEKLSHTYMVREYNDYLADDTVRIETYQKGSILNGFDYTGINWYQSIRIKGKFWNKRPELTKSSFLDTSRRVTQIQDKISNNFTLETGLLPSNIFNPINYDSLLGNDIFITDYNLQNQEIYRREAVDFDGFEAVENHQLSTMSSFVYKFKSRKDNVIKQNIDGYYNLLPYKSNIVTPEVCANGTININGSSFDTVASGGTKNVIVKNDLGAQVGSKIGTEWIVPSGATPSGILYMVDVPSLRTSYDTNGYDSGGRIQSGFYNYTPPSYPSAIAQLDTSLSNHFFRLKNNNIFGNKLRFTDVDGGQTFSATSNKNAVFIDHLTGYMWTCRRGSGSSVGGTSWQDSINNADAFSIVVNGNTYNDWYRPDVLEIKKIVGDNAPGDAIVDGANTIASAGSPNQASSTTIPAFTTYTYYIDSNGQLLAYLKSGSYGGLHFLFRKHLW